MRTSNYLFLGVVFLAILVAGCAINRSLDDGAKPDFRLRGKIGVRTVGDPSGGAFSASFDWVQAGDAYRIELWGPFGQGRARLVGDGQRVAVTDARGHTVAGERPEMLMHREFGWSAPVQALRYWVRGNPAPGVALTGAEHDADGRLTRFEQHGWVVELSRWRQREAGVVPGKIVATGLARRITIIGKQWSLGRAANGGTVEDTEISYAPK